MVLFWLPSIAGLLISWQRDRSQATGLPAIKFRIIVERDGVSFDCYHKLDHQVGSYGAMAVTCVDLRRATPMLARQNQSALPDKSGWLFPAMAARLDDLGSGTPVVLKHTIQTSLMRRSKEHRVLMQSV
jgi:hypothetical protein